MPLDTEDAETESGNEGIRSQSEKLINPWAVIIIICIIALAAGMFYPWKPNELINVPTIELLPLGILSMIITKDMWFGYMRYHTAQIICFGMHASTSSDPRHEAGLYHIYTLGDVRWGVEFRGAQGTLIGFANQFKKIGRNIYGMGWVQMIDMEEIPFSIAKRVLTDKACKPPYYLLWYHPYFEENIPDLESWRVHFLNTTRMLSLNREIIEVKNKTLDSYEQQQQRSIMAYKDAMKEGRRLRPRVSMEE